MVLGIKVAVLLAILVATGDAVEIGPQLSQFLNTALNTMTVLLIIIHGGRVKHASDTVDKVAEALPYVSIGRAHKVEELINGEDK